ncbi:MAG: DinB family protein [Phaeodactylibacter sp.]|nr:DinB family protein [Phaeodactylibacter sp.]MCB9293399.1 DinB family protein [Lewinellaceae bacterium]
MEISTISSFLDYYASIRARTERLIATVPPGQLDFTYQPGKFTIADQIRHIAGIERYMYAETLAGRPSRYVGCGRELADGYEAILAFFRRAHEETIAIIRDIGDEGLSARCRTPAGTSIRRWKWMRAMVEHEVHHRAQIYLYLNMLDIRTPPMFGLTSEELIARAGG